MLRPDGRLALYEVCAGSTTPPHFPVPWASDPTLSFLVSPAEMRHQLEQAGFRPLIWTDISQPCLQWFHGLRQRLAARPSTAPPPLAPGLLMGPTAGQKVQNIGRNLAEGRIRVIQAVVEVKLIIDNG